MNPEKRRRRAKRKAREQRLERNQGSVCVKRLFRGEYELTKKGEEVFGS